MRGVYLENFVIKLFTCFYVDLIKWVLCSEKIELRDFQWDNVINNWTGFGLADLTVTIMGAVMALCGMVQGLMSLILSFICSQAVCGIRCMVSLFFECVYFVSPLLSNKHIHSIKKFSRCGLFTILCRVIPSYLMIHQSIYYGDTGVHVYMYWLTFAYFMASQISGSTVYPTLWKRRFDRHKILMRMGSNNNDYGGKGRVKLHKTSHFGSKRVAYKFKIQPRNILNIFVKSFYKTSIVLCFLLDS